MSLAELAVVWSREIVAISWQFAVLAGISWMVLRFAGDRLSAKTRHLIWLVVLMRLLLPFGLSSPWGLVGSSPKLGSPVSISMGTSAPVSMIAGAPTASEQAIGSAGLGPVEWTFILWSAGVVVLLGVWMTRSIRLTLRLRRRWSPASESLQDQVRSHCRNLGLRRRIPVMEVEDETLRGPGVHGVLRPRIILPHRSFGALPDEQRAAVLVHELVHISRWDHLSQTLTSLLQCLYFFHPAVWLLARALRAERERAVDDRVVANLGDQVGRYAEALLQFALEGRRPLTAPTLGMAALRSQVARRLGRMLAEGYSADRRSRRAVLALALLAIVATVTLGASAMNDPVPEGERPKIRVMFTYPAAQIFRDDQPKWVEVGGDFELGRIAKESLDLRSRLDALPPEKVDLLGDQRSIVEVIVDATGRPESVKVLQSVQSELDEFLVETVSNMRFDPTRHRVDGPVPVRINVHFFQDKKRTLAPTGRIENTMGSEELEKRFAAIYALEPGRVLKLMPAPHPEERMALYRVRNPSQAELIPEGPSMMLVELRDGVAQYGGACFGCESLGPVLVSFGIPRCRILGEAELLQTSIETDLLVEEDSSMGQRLEDLDRELRDRFGLAVRAVQHETEIIVMRGRFGEISGAPGSNGKASLWLSLEGGEDDGSGSAIIRSARRFAGLLERHVGVPIEVEGVPDPEESFELHLRRSTYQTERIPELLRIIEAQTELALSLETRKIDAVVVEKAE